MATCYSLIIIHSILLPDLLDLTGFEVTVYICVCGRVVCRLYYVRVVRRVGMVVWSLD